MRPVAAIATGWIAWAGLGGAIALNFLAPLPPLQDFNEWLYQGWLTQRLFAGHADGVALKTWPVPNALVQVLLAGLDSILDPQRAGRLLMALYVAAFAALCWRLARRTEMFALLVPMAILDSPYWSGYLNFQLGLLLLLLHLLLVRDGRRLPIWAEAGFGVLIFFAHAVALAMYGVHVGWRALLQRGWRRGAARAMAVMLPALLLLAWYVRADRDWGEAIPQQGNGIVGFLAYKFYTLAKSGPYQNLLFGDAGDAVRHPLIYNNGVVLNLVFAVAVLLPLMLGVLRSLLAGRAGAECLTSLTGFCLFALLPSALFGVVNISERFLIPALAFALIATDDFPGLRRAGAWLACATPLLILYIALILPARPAGADIDHLAITDRGTRLRLLFWHRPFQFHDSFAATGTDPTRNLRFSTGSLTSR